MITRTTLTPSAPSLSRGSSVSSFNGRNGSVTLSKNDVIGTGVGPADLGAVTPSSVIGTDGKIGGPGTVGVTGSIVKSSSHYDLGTDAFGNMAIGDAFAYIVPGVVPNKAGYNTAVGSGALDHLTQGSFNTAVGHGALQNFTTSNYGVEPQGGENTAIGQGAHNALIDGYWNVSVGRSAMAANQHGIRNTAVGALALASLNGNGLNDGENTGVGFEVMNNATIGQYNTVVGALGMSNAVPMTGNANTGVGHSVLFNVSTGGNNTAIGKNALYNLTTAGQNTALGFEALKTSNAFNNTAVGHQAGLDTGHVTGVITGTDNTYIGYQSGPPAGIDPTQASTLGSGAIAGSYATAVGYQSNASGGAGATAMGYQAQAAGAYATAIGPLASASANGSVAIGRDNAGTGASTATINEIKLGTALHTINIPTTSAVGNGASTGLTALAKGTGGGPASDAVNAWIPFRNGTTSGFIPFFV